ncbi:MULTISPECIES: ferrochelatase [unclassified Guyparkeria]|uniref:ferrochelatase n=1 Tax=unclassified Guyparkeria TaxID=2626246 RepID=UPI0007333D1E|nr:MULTISPECIES: ferrochelatase [unclassified Guyparkeria]KTG16723.1 ferrochelatase [Guyparkeria sp. XI15]OAE85757.1 ferrochelatase [Guyparkeria sp. WRN-7]
MHYQGEPDYKHGSPERLGVLLLNLGTPDAPEAPALRRYLKQFLSDPRVIELPKWKWWPILHGVVLRTRPAKSAEAYRSVWDHHAEGSPLLTIAREQQKGLQERLSEQMAGPVTVALGMRYGNPSVPSALHELREAGCRRVVVLPLYPQYAGATTASTLDAVFDELMHWRWVPELRTINQYHRDPGYLDALAASIQEHIDAHGKPDKLIMSYHGEPKRYLLNGDPYHCQCYVTSRLVAERLGLSEDDYMVTFQSRFGPEEWLKPYTDETLKALPGQGVKHVAVVCPGFSADCLETIEEIGDENREYFEEAGGETYHYIPALNERADHLDGLARLVRQHTQGWVEHSEFDSVEDQRERERVRENALKVGAKQ